MPVRAFSDVMVSHNLLLLLRNVAQSLVRLSTTALVEEAVGRSNRI